MPLLFQLLYISTLYPIDLYVLITIGSITNITNIENVNNVANMTAMMIINTKNSHADIYAIWFHDHLSCQDNTHS